MENGEMDIVDVAVVMETDGETEEGGSRVSWNSKAAGTAKGKDCGSARILQPKRNIKQEILRCPAFIYCLFLISDKAV